MERIMDSELRNLMLPLEELEAFRRLEGSVRTPGYTMLYGTDESQAAHVLAALSEKTGRPLVILTADERAGMRLMEDLNVLLNGRAAFLPGAEVSFVQRSASSRDLTARRLSVLGRCMTGETRALIACADALMWKLQPPERFRERIISLSQSDQVDPTDLVRRLAEAGYEHVTVVEGSGQFALRGGILDVFPIGSSTGLRIEFFGDEIDSMRTFDTLTQRSIANVREFRLFPASECLMAKGEEQEAAQMLSDMIDLDGQRDREGGGAGLRQTFAPVLDALRRGTRISNGSAILPVLLGYRNSALSYLTDPIVVFDQTDAVRERCDNAAHEFRETLEVAVERGLAFRAQAGLMWGYEHLLAECDAASTVCLNRLMRTERDIVPRELITLEGRNASRYQGNIPELVNDLRLWRDGGWRVLLLAGGRNRSARLLKAVEDQGFYEARASEQLPEELEARHALILPFTLNRGFLYPEIRLAVICEGDIYGVNRQKKPARSRGGERIAAFTDLHVGDYVVHENHGIGQYMGTVQIVSEGVCRDFLYIRYLGNDKLYVPTDQLERVQKYIGQEGVAPKLSRLSGSEWQRQKSKVKQSIRDIAGDLLKLYAKREASKGYAFEPDTPWQREFEDNFPFEETPDQLTAIAEVKRDMEASRPMDRLLCGDVGYGKTEVALRAIFKAVLSGKQAAMLAPTTILVQQHYATMLNRFSGFPVRVESLSRFKTPQEQKKILVKLAAGELDVVVGTHRLLGKDVVFKDLGLLVVDEEQRFGVRHKEAIKRYRESIDVLTLTATPIPRTLHMSMVGIRDMSLLQTPPEERYPVQTYVVEYSDMLVRDAILRECGRGGQVYFLYNRVQTIEIMFAKLKQLVPEVRIAFAHGQMRDSVLEDVMLDFYDGKYDVLLCTTIIEAGLDLPRANTLIVCDADRFGLSQLYQLRGRVGRSNRLAYAYFTVSPSRVLTETADRRLQAIREFTEFGSGFRVAMRDLEIRGAGNLLGAEQSGFMASVGYDLYVKMIEETRGEMRGDTSLSAIEAHIDLRVDAYIPPDYISDELLRLEMYKRIAQVHDMDDREDVIEELIDRFGEPGSSVINLIHISLLRYVCSRLTIDHVSASGGDLRMRIAMQSQIDFIRMLKSVRMYPEITVQASNPPVLILARGDRSTEELLSDAAKCMLKVLRAYDAQADGKEEAKET
ncbi:MAG: transcription-repair coupling factor [Clostridia bacterium]|nr:transcription-repair coupling factor [Clostridia bacterium]